MYDAFVKAIETHMRHCVILSATYWITWCAADDKFAFPREDFVHVFTTIPHLRPLEKQNDSAARVWVIILGVLGGIVIVLTCIFCYYAVLRRPFFRQNPVSNSRPAPASEFHPPPSAPVMEEESWNRASRRSEGPPEYTSVVLGVHRLSVPEQQKKAETPPPAYITVAPFQ